MSDVVLVVASRPEGCDGLLAAARHLGGLTGNGRVRMLAVTPFPTGQLDLSGVAVEQLRAGADVTAEVEKRGTRADFVVIAQPGAADDPATHRAFEAALFKTERPVLMIPAGSVPNAFGRRVAIAWRDDARALKALVPALRLLDSAEEVHLFTGVRPGTPTPGIPPVLAEHRVTATLHVLAIGATPFGQLLLSRVHEAGADLLVMGAEAHNRLSELLFGGMTRYILANAALPVLYQWPWRSTPGGGFPSRAICNSMRAGVDLWSWRWERWRSPGRICRRRNCAPARRR